MYPSPLPVELDFFLRLFIKIIGVLGIIGSLRIKREWNRTCHAKPQDQVSIFSLYILQPENKQGNIPSTYLAPNHAVHILALGQYSFLVPCLSQTDVTTMGIVWLCLALIARNAWRSCDMGLLRFLNSIFIDPLVRRNE